ncbi:FAD/NAD(P)-binding protein [Leucobacter weissii]|uniref:FAD/NAD(P)-binding protein n=1 Tax=Leucobacter weissii TaxID=1983706 RepID=A0A939SBE7_9MICO|nr:FAD/NAD(P)-binding protein [Leucobacter weissii]
MTRAPRPSPGVGRTPGGSGVGIVIIGAGPAAVMLLERLLANHAAVSPNLGLEIRLVDPHEPGGGRIWRRNQSPLLKLNSMFEDVAFFTDASCRIEGPVAPGPSLAEWVELVRAGEIDLPEWADALLRHEVETSNGRDFPTRRLNNAYLGWAYDEVRRRSSPAASVVWQRDTAVAVSAAEDAGDGGPYAVELASGARIVADIVVYALGHNGAQPSDEAILLAEFAAAHGLGYVAPAFTADLELDWVPAGEDVIVRGMGLAAVDLVVLLTEGRGGRFARDAEGALRYLPSGREPVLHLGSRRGVPYRSKITSELVGDPVALEYLGPDFHDRVAASDAPLDFDRDVWPLVAAELLTGYYRELFTGHPERVVGDWSAFAPRLRRVLAETGGYASERLAELIRAHVPDPADRFDLASFDRPLVFAPDVGDVVAAGAAAGPGRSPADAADPADAVTARVREHIVRDLSLRTEQRRSAVQGLFFAALFAYASLAEVPPERWNAVSRTRSLPKRWHTFFSYLASGPPGHRLEELLALADAGAVRFLGGDLRLSLDDEAGRFVAEGSARTRAGVALARRSARTLIDAWLPEAQAARSDNPLLRRLVADGVVAELRLADAAHRGSTGQIEVLEGGALPGAPRQFALGPFTSVPGAGAFTRPGIDSLPFRVHDRVARAILEEALGAAEAAGARRQTAQTA